MTEKEAAHKFKTDPVHFFEKILGVDTLELYQKEVIRAVNENERTAIAACHDVGKSFLMARIAIWFLSTHVNSKVISTAPTFNQVERILWSELRSAHKKAKFPLGGRLNNTDWTFSPDWFALGFTPKTEVSDGQGQGTQSSFQGFHAKDLLVIFDEATGIPPNIWSMAEGLLTSANVKFVAIGNPTSSQSEFFRCFKSPGWKKVYLSCFDSPNLIANGITTEAHLISEINKVQSMPDVEARAYLDSYKVTRPYLLTAKWVVESARKWGIGHPLTVSKALGKFPEASDNALTSLGDVERAQLRSCKSEASDRRTIGVDVARFGSDSTVITVMEGKRVTERIERFKHDAIQISGEVIALAKQNNTDIIVIDETGVGGGVVDLLKDAMRDTLPINCDVRGVQFGAACESEDDREKYVNLKARMFGLLAEDIKRFDGVVLLDDAIYSEELPSILYRYDKKGRMFIESKDEYKKRTGRGSPDSADSLALANYGHYDELSVGSFGDIRANDEAPAPMSGGLRGERGY